MVGGRDESPESNSLAARPHLDGERRTDRLQIRAHSRAPRVERHDDRRRNPRRRLESRQTVDRFAESATSREWRQLRDDMHDADGVSVGIEQRRRHRDVWRHIRRRRLFGDSRSQLNRRRRHLFSTRHSAHVVLRSSACALLLRIWNRMDECHGYSRKKAAATPDFWRLVGNGSATCDLGRRGPRRHFSPNAKMPRSNGRGISGSSASAVGCERSVAPRRRAPSAARDAGHAGKVSRQEREGGGFGRRRHWRRVRCIRHGEETSAAMWLLFASPLLTK